MVQAVVSSNTPNTPPEDLEGPRACGPFELPGVLDLSNLVLRTLNTPAGQPARQPSVGFDYPHVFNPHNLDNIRIFAHRGRVVCSVGIYPATVRTPRGDISTGGISLLVTHPDYRRRGLGARIMADAHRKMTRAEAGAPGRRPSRGHTRRPREGRNRARNEASRSRLSH